MIIIKSTKAKRSGTGIWRLAVFVFVLCVFGVPVQAQSLESALRNANKLTLEYRNKLKELEQWCESQGLSEEAERIRHYVVPTEDDKVYIPKLPLKIRKSRHEAGGMRRETGAAAPLANIASNEDVTIVNEIKSSTKTSSLKPQASSLTRDWESELHKLQKEYAQKLFSCAKTAARHDRGSLAIQMALAALHADSDHPAARKLLGFAKYKDEWRTPWEAEQLRKGRIDHPRFGWIIEKNVKRYEAGERLHAKKWISEKEDAQNRKKILKGWAVESEHYIVLTNHSMEEGVRATRKLEDLYRAWKLLFYRYMASDRELASLFEGKGAPKPQSQRHQVWLFRDRDDYVETLSPSQPFAKHSLGFYTTTSNRCYFFSVDPKANREAKEDVDRTLLHEATHQLFAEARLTRPTAGNLYNFWILEGIAMYMETLHSSGGYYTVGGTDDIRFQNAAYEVYANKFYVPLEEFTKVGRNKFQSADMKVLSSLYAQSAGLAHFLMHAEDSEYRDATVRYLRLVYEEKDQPATLQKLTAVSYERLDEKYKEYLKERVLKSK